MEPDIPALQKTMTAAGKKVSSPASFTIAKDAEQLVFVVDISGYVYPYIGKELKYGDFSKEPIIENFQLQDDRFTIDLWGKGNTMIHFYTDGKIECLGGEVQQSEGITTLVIEFNKRWERRTITGKIY